MKKIELKKQFTKDFEKLSKTGKIDKKSFSSIINDIAAGKPLDQKYRDHALAKHSPKELQGCRDFHYKSNICVVYKVLDDLVQLIRIGSHQDLGLTEDLR